MKEIFRIPLEVEGSFVRVYSDDVGYWMEIHNGEEGVEALASAETLERLHIAIQQNRPAIRHAEQIGEPAE